MPTLNEEIDAQVKAGMCVRGETPTGCLLRDGSEAACQTIRECSPSQHFEYALPGSTPNVNIWVYGEDGPRWSGSVETTPVFQPGIHIDPISGLPNPFVDYEQVYTLPSLPYGPGGTNPPNYTGPRGPGNGTGSTGGSPIAPAYGLGLGQDLDTLSRSLYGRTTVTQVEFCTMYQRLTGFACDFNASVSGSKEVAAWLAQLQSEQNARVSVVGNQTLPGYTTPIGGGTQPLKPGLLDPGTGGLFGLSPIMIILIIAAIVFFRK